MSEEVINSSTENRISSEADWKKLWPNIFGRRDDPEKKKRKKSLREKVKEKVELPKKSPGLIREMKERKEKMDKKKRTNRIVWNA